MANPQAADTLYAVLTQPPLQHAADLATTVLMAVLAVFFGISLFILVGLWRRAKQLEAVLQEARKDLAPVVDRGRAVAENVEFMSNVVRKDFERIRSRLDGLGARLGEASDEMEHRIQEFNALLDVVQGEAEDLFLDAASTVKGVRTGASEIAPGRGRGDRGDPPLP